VDEESLTMVKTKAKLNRLRRLAALCQQVSLEMEEETPLPLSPKQSAAIDTVLRTLDLLREYEAGDELRVAFQVELDVVKDHRKRGLYDERER
jgi:hypothetical protein